MNNTALKKKLSEAGHEVDFTSITKIAPHVWRISCAYTVSGMRYTKIGTGKSEEDAADNLIYKLNRQ